MNSVMKAKLLMAVILFGTWVWFVRSPVENADKLIDFIYTTLLALGAHTAWTSKRNQTPPNPSDPSQTTTEVTQ